MYTAHFGFNSKPFKSKDSKDFFRNTNFDAACADILDGIRERRGFVLLTGEAGVGKTLMLRRCMAEADDIRFILLVNAHLDFPDIINYLCTNLELPVAGLAVERQSRLLLDALATRAHRNQPVALLIDDAQHLATEALLHLQEFVETPAIPSQRLQVVLAGLPDLASKLDQPELRRLRNSIRVRCHLERLSELETGLFIEHQLKVAGHAGGSLLPPAAIKRINMHCKGASGAITLLCDTVFLFASLQSERAITPELVDTAARTRFLGELFRLATQIGDTSFVLPRRETSASPLPASPPRVGRHRLNLVNVLHKPDQQTGANELRPAPQGGSPQAGLHIIAKSMEPRSAGLLFGDDMRATDSHTQEGNKPNALENLRSATGKYPWLTHLLSPSTEQENPMSRLDNLNKILKNLQNESPGVEASALISEDGLMIASALPQDLDETRVAGMTATLLNLGTRASTELRRGDVQEVIVRGEYGYSVMISAGRGALLLVLTNENSKLGLIFFDMREAIKAIKNIL